MTKGTGGPLPPPIRIRINCRLPFLSTHPPPPIHTHTHTHTHSIFYDRDIEKNKSTYNADFSRRNIYRPTEVDATNRNPTPVTTVTIPYIKDTSETISQILQPYSIRVAHKPTTTLRHLLTNVKDKDEPNNRQGAVYNIKCFLHW